MGSEGPSILLLPVPAEPLFNELLVLAVFEGKQPDSLIIDLTHAQDLNTLVPEALVKAQEVDFLELEGSVSV